MIKIAMRWIEPVVLVSNEKDLKEQAISEDIMAFRLRQDYPNPYHELCYTDRLQEDPASVHSIIYNSRTGVSPVLRL